MKARIRQLALPFDPAPRFEPGDFIEAASNAEARAWLARTADWPLGRLAVWGPPGCGKTHLLHGWALREGAEILRGPEIDAELVPAPPAHPLAIDEADATPEYALLHLLNAAGEAGQPVLLASNTPPGRWDVALPDLASRLRAMTAVAIAAADDELLRLLFRRLLVERHLAVPEPVQEHLLRHLPRTPAALRLAAARLDRAAFSARAQITRPLAAAALAGLLDADEDDTSMTDAPAPSRPDRRVV